MSAKATTSMHHDKQRAQRLAMVLVAAGSGSRLGGDTPKQFQDFAGEPLFVHSLRTLQGSGLVSYCVIVVPPGWQETVAQQLARVGLSADAIVVGGATRQQSVRCGLEAIRAKAWPASHVLIHDAARPFVSQELVRTVVAAVHDTGAATLAVPVSDTLMRAATASGPTSPPRQHANELIDRSGMWAIQTPQVFELALLLQAHDQAAAQTEATDDGSLVVELGRSLHFVPGAWWNIKVTHPEDFDKARLIAAIRRLPSTQFPDAAASDSGGKT
jgi:2-C-methyl-D-erythritol 4-phosphate cytidylyltransferase